MSDNHTGNILNSITQEEHDGSNNSKRVSIVSGAVGNATVNIAGSATIFAVVNTSAAGVQNSLVTVLNPVSIAGNVTLSDPKGYIGLVTIGNTVSTTFSGNVTLDAGSKTGIVGNVTISDSKSFIGLVSVGGGTLNTITAVTDITNPIAIKGNVTLSDSKTYIGLVSLGGGFANIRGNVTLSDSKAFIGLATTVNGVGDRFIGLVTAWVSGVAGNVTLSDSKTFIGLTTSVALNGGTNRTLDWKPVTLSTASILTLFTPTNANKVYVTSVLLNSDATVRVSIKSGVTYLTGNASIGIVLNPGGGWVERGSVDSPAYIGCASGPLIVEKFDITSTKANVGGKLIYYQE